MAVPAKKALDVLLAGADPEQVAAAVHEMGFIAKQNNTKLQSLEDAIPPLLALMKTDNIKCREAALRVLQVLAESRFEWKSLIVAGGVIECCVETLKLNHLNAGLAISAAAKALWKLAIGDKAVQEAATALGCMPLLVNLLVVSNPTQPGGKEIQKWSVSALHSLSTLSTTARLAAVDAGAMQAAMDVHSAGPEIRKLVSELMHTLKPLMNVDDQTPNVADKARYQTMGANGSITDHMGKHVYSM